MKNYKMLRGPIAEARCTNKSIYGSPLYCDCGCQTPRDTDPEINLSGVTISRKSGEGYANCILTRDGKECGSINTQYNYICIDGNEFLGVEEAFITDLLTEARKVLKQENTYATGTPGETPEETAAAVKMAEEIELDEMDARNAQHPGYCTKCHSWCYGDCETN
jgi:hypothetical protein